jgi:hypothetical protein
LEREREREAAARILNVQEDPATQLSTQEGEFSQTEEGIDGSQGINCSQMSLDAVIAGNVQDAESEGEIEQDVVEEAEAVPQGVPPEKGACQLLYEAQENSKQYLLVMSIGLVSSSGRKLGDCEEEPYKSVKSVRSVHPSLAQLRDEMNRRAIARGMPELRKKTAPKPACLSWLLQHAEEDPQNRAWLMKEEELYFRSLMKGSEEREEMDKSASSN